MLSKTQDPVGIFISFLLLRLIIKIKRNLSKAYIA